MRGYAPGIADKLIPLPKNLPYPSPIHPRTGGLQATVAGWAGRMGKPPMRVKELDRRLRALGAETSEWQKTGRPGAAIAPLKSPQERKPPRGPPVPIEPEAPCAIRRKIMPIWRPA